MLTSLYSEGDGTDWPPVSVTPSLTPRSGTPQPPPIPPRATPSTLMSDESALSRSRAGSIKSQAPPLPRRGSPAPAHLSSSPNSTNPNSTLPLAVRREAPPPPNRTQTSASSTSTTSTQELFKPSSSTIEEIQRRRAVGPPSNGAPSSNKMPPPAVPKSKKALDLDSPAPAGLLSPLQPTERTPAPALPARKATLPTSATPPIEKQLPAPVVPARKPVPTLTDENPKLPRADDTLARKITVPPSPRAQKTGSVADRLKQWEQIGTPKQPPPKIVAPRSPTKSSINLLPSPTKSSSTNIGKERQGPPSIPRKPETLRKVSSTNGGGSSPP